MLLRVIGVLLLMIFIGPLAGTSLVEVFIAVVRWIV